MQRLTILLVFLFILFIHFNQQQAARIDLSSLDEFEDQPSQSIRSSLLNSWYNHLNDMQESDQQEYIDHLWKRFSPNLPPFRQRRRFGNTRYGRSLSNNRK